MSMNGAGHGYDHIAMACQGGGSLGAYHIGALEAMQQAHYEPDAVAGISIGAFTAAIIAGNEPRHRVAKLREFWEMISWPDIPPLADGLGWMKKMHNQLSSLQGFLMGQPAFFQPRFPGLMFQPAGTPEATSFYSTDLLRESLPEVVDFDYLNRGKTRLILGATRVRDGQPRWFDNRQQTIGPDHVMASGAMPPGFPAVRIDGELYWDGGCYSNTPLDGLYEAIRDEGDTLCFVIDLFGPNGREPQDMSDVALTIKEIQFSNRSKRNIERVAERHNHVHLLRHLMEHHPEALQALPHCEEIQKELKVQRFDLVHIIYQKPGWEVSTCDCEFSRSSIQDRQGQGFSDLRKALDERERVVRQRRTIMESASIGSVVDTFAKGLMVGSSFRADTSSSNGGAAPVAPVVTRPARRTRMNLSPQTEKEIARP